MKRSFIKNIFLSAMVVAGSKVAVDRAFEKTDMNINMNLSKISQISLLNSMDSTNEEIDLIDFSDIETLDANNRFVANGAVKTIIKEKITYIEDIEKPIEFSNTNLKSTTDTVEGARIVSGETLDLSLSEIKEDAIVEVRELPTIAWTELYEPIENTLQEDRISTALAATEKSTNQPKSQKAQDVIEKKVEAPVVVSDEMQFFDYREKNEFAESNSQAKLAQETEVVPSIKAVKSKRTFTNQTSKKENLISVLEETMAKAKYERIAKRESNNQVAVNNRKENEKQRPAQEHGFAGANNKSFACLDEESRNIKRSFKANYKIEASSIDYSKKKLGSVHNFELRFEDDIDEIHQDYGEGKVNLNFKLNSKMSTRRVSVYQKNHVPVEMDFTFEGTPGNESAEANIPLFEIATFNKLVKGNGLNGNGGHVLVELDQKTEDVEVDANYEAKFFLDKNFKAVDRNEAEYSYLLFVGVKPGNTLIEYKTAKNEITNRVVNISNEKVYFDPNFYNEVKADQFELYEEQLLSKTCKSLLNVAKNEVIPFSFNAKVSKKSLNKVEINKAIYPMGTRKYYKLNHLNEAIILGRWNDEKIVIPSEDYVRHVIGQFEVHGQPNQCVIQINLTKTAKELFFNSMSPNNSMQTQVNILDKDGQFYDGLSPESEKVFLMGEEEGVINVKINYVDGSSDYIQSFCTESTYLVEQL